jgi:hypothetical protein
MTKIQIETDLSKLAQLKIKLDLFEEKYKQAKEKLQKELQEKEATEYIDKENGLKFSLVNSPKRVFNLLGVKSLCEENKVDLSAVIEVSVSAKKFDIAFKSGKSYTISEDKQQECFSFISNPYLTWDGLDTYKDKITALVTGEKDGKSTKAADGIEVA